MEEGNQSTKSKLKSFGRECWRVLRITKKPTMKEYKIVVSVTGIGILLIGFIGFLITMARQIFFS